jgi:hypothetical protein
MTRQIALARRVTFHHTIRTRSPAEGGWLNMGSKRRPEVWAAVLVAIVALAGAVTVFGESSPSRDSAGAHYRAPRSIKEIERIYNEAAAKPRFDGTILGWRIAPASVLRAEGIADLNLSRTCAAEPAGEETKTELDISLTYFPDGITIEGISGPSKWVCGGEALRVAYSYHVETPFGAGVLDVERAIWGRRALDASVPRDSVEAGAINGKAAIFLHPADDASGLGISGIIVLERATGSEFTILRLIADDGIPFAELIKIAEGVK